MYFSQNKSFAPIVSMPESLLKGFNNSMFLKCVLDMLLKSYAGTKKNLCTVCLFILFCIFNTNYSLCYS